MKLNKYKIILFSIASILFGCGEKNIQKGETLSPNKKVSEHTIRVTEAQFTQGKMTLGKLEEKPLPTVVAVNGMIDVPPENRAVVNASMGGYIKTTPLLVGDKVRKGQVLVTVQNLKFITLQQQYLEVSEQLFYLKAEYERQATMKTEKITSKKSFLKAKSEYKTAVARHTGLEKQLLMLNISPSHVRAGKISSIVKIYAPISGSITKVNVTKGSYVSPATEIMEIIDSDHIHLELSVFEKDIMNIKKGQKIDFKIPEVSEKVYTAKVNLVGTSIQENRTIKVHGHLEGESDNNFLTGMFVEARIISNSTVSKALPSESIIVVDEIPYVLVLDKKEDNSYYFYREKVVVIGEYLGYSIIEGKNGFKSDEQFLTKGAFNLLGD